MTASLTAAIYRYKAAMYAHLAQQSEAEDRGEDVAIPVDYWSEIKTLEEWDRPAESIAEAMDALAFAIEDSEIGETPRILAMIKAAHGWIQNERHRRAEA